ncbi:MAG: hypothetical protein IPL58_14310 [Betaproteobacteria bacterium]|uniref:Uncharacterized protein n=1 Tax=Candidatus Proximibacter danicus TaxID=2954365 RepID=A0A9D7PRC8_9PROT|nr:hypothetical protein [Candidatus Proximibacter danicus]
MFEERQVNGFASSMILTKIAHTNPGFTLHREHNFLCAKDVMSKLKVLFAWKISRIPCSFPFFYWLRNAGATYRSARRCALDRSSESSSAGGGNSSSSNAYTQKKSGLGPHNKRNQLRALLIARPTR